jgi:multidrug efflux system membrane fusion protein
MSVRAADSVAEPTSPVLVINGRTEPARMVVLSAETSGRVVDTPIDEGILVQAGDVIARIDERDRPSRLRESEARLAQAELEYRAASKLVQKQFQAETRVAEMLAMREAARAEVDRAKLDLEHTRIVAPFPGVLEKRDVEVGAFVDNGDKVAVLIEQDPYHVVGDAPETSIGAFKLGQKGRAVLADGSTVQGTVSYVASDADAATRTYRVELDVPNPGRRFQAGMSARIEVELPPVAAHRISAALLVLDDDGRLGIKAVDDTDTIRFFPARIVRAEAEDIWLGGLPERLRLITVGQGFVVDGQRVRVQLEPAGSAAALGEARVAA